MGIKVQMPICKSLASGLMSQTTTLKLCTTLIIIETCIVTALALSALLFSPLILFFNLEKIKTHSFFKKVLYLLFSGGKSFS